MADQTYYRWCKVYGGMRIDPGNRRKELEAEHSRPKRGVANLTVDKLNLKEFGDIRKNPTLSEAHFA